MNSHGLGHRPDRHLDDGRVAPGQGLFQRPADFVATMGAAARGAKASDVSSWMRRTLPNAPSAKITATSGMRCRTAVAISFAVYMNPPSPLIDRPRRALLVPGMNDRKAIGGVVQGVLQLVVVHSGQRVDGLRSMRQESRDGGFADRHVDGE